jgi:hypothetical protein
MIQINFSKKASQCSNKDLLHMKTHHFLHTFMIRVSFCDVDGVIYGWENYKNIKGLILAT